MTSQKAKYNQIIQKLQINSLTTKKYYTKLELNKTFYVDICKKKRKKHDIYCVCTPKR